MRKLLVPIDTGDLSDNLKNTLKDLVNNLEYEVTLFNVIPLTPVEHNLMHFDLYVRDKAKAHLEANANSTLDKAEAALNALGIKNVVKVHADGDPAEEILKMINSNQFQYIIMNTHGLGAARRLLIGSVTNKVVHHSKIPVISIS